MFLHQFLLSKPFEYEDEKEDGEGEEGKGIEGFGEKAGLSL
jgi:hypothetical protein